MSFRTFWKDSFWAFALRNVLVAALLLALIILGVFYALDSYTHHGEAVEVPDLRGMYEPEAGMMLSGIELRYEVVDSTYNKRKPLGTVLEQSPQGGTMVKKGRAIYLIMNSKQKRMVPMPEVRDLSYRQAESMLRTLSITVGDVTYKPAEYQGLVLDVLYNDEPIEAGTRIAEDSRVTLVVGEQQDEEQTLVPDLKGMSLYEAREALLRHELVVGMTDYDVEPEGNEALYVVYRQSVAQGRSVNKGRRIDIFLTTNVQKVQQTEQTIGEDEFF